MQTTEQNLSNSAGTLISTSDCRHAVSCDVSGGAGTSVHTSNRRHDSSCVSTILPNGINTEGRPIAGIDWSRGEVIVNVEGQSITRFKTLAEAAPHYQGYIWVLESTADSFELQNRQVDLDAIKAADIRAYCFNSKYTSEYRIKWNNIPKSDEADSEVISRIFTKTKLNCSVFKQIIRDDPLRDAINRAIIEDRQFKGEKSVAFAKENLPSFLETPPHLHQFLYKPETIKSKKPKNPTPKKQIGRLLMAAVKVRGAGGGWRAFRRQVGNYGQGYPCMLRSEFYWWLIRTILAARMKQAGITKTVKMSHVDPKTKEEKQIRIWTPQEEQMKKEVMKEMDVVLKWLWRLTG